MRFFTGKNRNLEIIAGSIALAVILVAVTIFIDRHYTSTRIIPTPTSTQSLSHACPDKITAQITFNGTLQQLMHNCAVMNISETADTNYQGPATNFFTSNDKYSCLNTQPTRVYSAPSEFPNYYVITAECPPAFMSTWIFTPPPPPPLTYTAQWTFFNKVVTLTLVTHNIKGPTDYVDNPAELPKYEGTVDNLTITPITPNGSPYACLQEKTLIVWFNDQWTRAHDIPSPPNNPANPEITYIVQGVCPAGTLGTWYFYDVPRSVVPVYYTASCCVLSSSGVSTKLVTETLKLVDLPSSIKTQQTQDNVTDFSTNDGTYACFEGETLPIYAIQGYPVGEYLVFGSCPLDTYIAWTFMDPSLKL